MDQALGMEVGLGLVYIVLDGDQLLCPNKGAEPPIFGPFLQRAAMRCNALIASAVLATALPSVRPSVCHTPVLCQNDGT